MSVGQFNRFARLGLSWQYGLYYRTTVNLRRDVVGVRLASQLPSVYSQKAVSVEDVERSAAWYSSETSDEVAVIFTKVRLGRQGYIGDVDGEVLSDAVFLAVFGLLG